MKLFTSTAAALALLATVASAQCDKSGLDVTVSPSSALPGQVITVKITNNTTSCTYNLPTTCVFRAVHEGGLNGATILNLFCGSMFTPIMPGQTLSQTWDQKDDLGTQVMDGSYVFKIEVYDPSFNKLKYGPSVAICGGSHPQGIYGPRSEGTGGIEPQLGYINTPNIGNSSYHLVIADTVGGAPAMIVIAPSQGSMPVSWGTFLVDPVGPITTLLVPMPGTPGSAGAGHLFIQAAIPSNPALVGVSGHIQTLISDSASSGGISHTNGLQVTICQ